ncbi:MAG: DsbA family protein [Gammaproteobacteria bacterium]|nr:DsbA family protein [Gammaproteobacteria bacterium]
MNKRLIYAHDPMCSWCWGFAETWQSLTEQLPDDLPVVRLLGGLAPDSDELMPEAMQEMLQQTWQHIEQVIPGKHFNFDFWNRCKPRRSTYPACRAVIAAREQGDVYDSLMTRQIQQAYYQQARNPSDKTTLIELATEIGMDADLFTEQLTAKVTHQKLLREISTVRSMGINGFPSVIVEDENGLRRIATSYTDVAAMLGQI